MFRFFTAHTTRSLRLIVLGVLVHICLFFGALDVYFSSPVEHGLTSFKANCSLADRAVIFVADGLRYEALRDLDNGNTPFLNKLRRQKAAWGVSNTRVPTESRPGHVALFGGMYEDPSAVLSGWKRNPINIDNVFNQSSESWLWGSPDIIPMFNRDNLKKINTFYYNRDFEDFSGVRSSIELDRWVINRVKVFFQDAFVNCKKNRCKELYKGGKIFFLHLLGMDTVGHVYKPNSKEYFDNLKYVDKSIGEMYDLFERFYRDKRTAYIFTSDHGMTDWGSHGSGTDHETQSPFLAWGSGLKKVHGVEINQADITPLISVLLGINIPTNSVGFVPYKLLNTSDEEELMMLLANIQQLGERFLKRHERIEKATTSGLLSPFEHLNKELFEDRIFEIENSILLKSYGIAKKKCLELLDLIKEGDKYISQRYKHPLLIALSIALFLWMFYLMLNVMGNEMQEFRYLVTDDCICNCVVNYNVLLIILMGVLQYNGIQLKYWFYILFPCLMVIPLLYEINQLIYVITYIFTVPPFKLILNITICILGILSLIFSFYYEPCILLPVMMMVLWIIYERNLYKLEDIFYWVLALLFVYFYPFKRHPYLQTMASFYITSQLILVQIKNAANSVHLYYYHLMKLITLSIAVFTTMIYAMFKVRAGFQICICISSWTLLCINLIFVAVSPGVFIDRCFNIGVLFHTIFVLMSTQGECLFLLAFIYVQLQWIFFETQLYDRRYATEDGGSTQPIFEEFRKCLFFISFILLSYFGPGNTANMNTFDPMWARRFVLLFNPFLSAFIILFKITIPFLIATISFQTINKHTKTATMSAFAIIMLYMEVLVLYFMHSIQNEGSWLAIGLSISRFVIVSLMTLVLLLFYGISRFLTNNRLYRKMVRRFSKRRRIGDFEI